ncbi:MAG: ABC transporter ATP-binding protein [Candidatus Sumerlaeaceae bacterium]
MTNPASALPPPMPSATATLPGGPSGAPPVIALTECSKWYGDVIGVNQVTMEIPRGITGLLGPNGAGKSTLMKLITGQLRPGRGTVHVFGENPWRNPEVFRRVGFCPDTDSFYEDLSGLEFVRLMGRLSGFDASESQRRAAERLERTGMAPNMKRRIRGYSKGMRQRTKLAAALMHDPELLILDEPLNGLDPMGRIQMLDLFRQFGVEGRTVLVSSHILHEVENLTRSIALLHHGRVLAEGRIEEVRALIENQPLTLRISSSAPRAIGQMLAGMDSVTSLQFNAMEGAEDAFDVERNGANRKNVLVVRSSRPEAIYEALQEGVLAGRFTIDELSALDENLDAVFQYLVKE